MLHADADLAIAVKGPVEAHNVGRIALVQNLQLPDDLVAHGRLDLQVDQLQEGRAAAQEEGQMASKPQRREAPSSGSVDDRVS